MRLLRVLRMLRVLTVPACIAATAAPWAPVTRLPPLQAPFLLLLLSLKVRRVGAGVVLHGRDLLGVDAGNLRRMLRAPTAVVQEGAVLGGAAPLVRLLQLLSAEASVADQGRTGGRQVAFRACCRRRPGVGGGGGTYCRLCCNAMALLAV